MGKGEILILLKTPFNNHFLQTLNKLAKVFLLITRQIITLPSLMIKTLNPVHNRREVLMAVLRVQKPEPKTPKKLISPFGN